jgi:DNA processing protein
LARAVIVVEAGVTSGALITASHALELDRTLAAVPGPIDVPQAQGSNELLRDGAAIIASMADALALVGLTAPVRINELPSDGAERRLWNALEHGAADLDTLCTRAALPANEAMAAASALEIRGLIECALTGEIRRI